MIMLRNFDCPETEQSCTDRRCTTEHCCKREKAKAASIREAAAKPDRLLDARAWEIIDLWSRLTPSASRKIEAAYEGGLFRFAIDVPAAYFRPWPGVVGSTAGRCTQHMLPFGTPLWLRSRRNLDERRASNRSPPAHRPGRQPARHLSREQLAPLDHARSSRRSEKRGKSDSRPWCLRCPNDEEIVKAQFNVVKQSLAATD